uniref:P-loop NTPase superfamily protein n=1 Tax=Dinoroseobacter phage vB_DshS_R26L TaxID=3161158 RepID=A0AAU7VFZ4_9CAUD
MIFTGFLARFAIGQTVGRVASRLPWQIWAALGVAVVLGITAWQINDRAYDRGFAEAERQWQERLEAELERQDAANREALRLAQEEIDRLTEAKEVRDATIARLIEEARQDPDADRPAVSAPGVRRLNSVLD